MNQKTVFISDVHLLGETSPREMGFIQFLDGLKGSISRLVIAGDLFDFWVGYSSFLYSKYASVLQKLRELSDAGVRIDYVEGNHDFFLGDFFKEDLRCHIYTERAHLDIDGKQVLVIHGDLANPWDVGARLLRWFLRSWMAKLLIRFLPPDVVWKIGHRSSSLSRQQKCRIDEIPEKVKILFRAYARQHLEASGADVCVLGHSHFPDEQRYDIQGKGVSYYNCGDWLTHFSYLEVDRGEFSLKKFVFDTPPK